MSYSLAKIDKMFSSVIKRSRQQIFTEFADRKKDQELSKTELYDIIEDLFETNKTPKLQKLTPYKLFIKENPNISRSELKKLWRDKSAKEKKLWKNKIKAIEENLDKKREFIYNEIKYLIDDDNMIYDFNDGREIGYYCTDDNIINFIE